MINLGFDLRGDSHIAFDLVQRAVRGNKGILLAICESDIHGWLVLAFVGHAAEMGAVEAEPGGSSSQWRDYSKRGTIIELKTKVGIKWSSGRGPAMTCEVYKWMKYKFLWSTQRKI